MYDNIFLKLSYQKQQQGASMTADQWGIAGIIIAILLAIPAYFAAKSVRSNQQSQKIGRDGSGFQAGGDININKNDD